MNKRFSNEDYSAYFDGEVTLEERAEIEGLLETLVDVKRELEEHRVLSELLKGLPQESISTDLSLSVIQTVKCQTTRWGRRTVCLLAASAVALVLMLNMPETIETQLEVAEYSATNKTHFEEAQGGTLSPESILRQGTDDENRVMRNSPREVAATPFSDSGVLNPGTSDGSRISGKSVTELVIEDVQGLQDAQIGAIVTALEKTRNGVQVVHLSVVDRQAGLTSLQVLLARQNIPKEQTEIDASVSLRKLDKKKSRELVAVYVEATSPQLTAALGEFRNMKQLQKLKLSGAIDADQIARISADRTYSGNRSKTATFDPQDGVGSDKLKDVRSRPSVEVPRTASRQVELSLSPETMRYSHPANLKESKKPEKPAVKKQQAAPVQVLFVILTQGVERTKQVPQGTLMRGSGKKGKSKKKSGGGAA